MISFDLNYFKMEKSFLAQGGNRTVGLTPHYSSHATFTRTNSPVSKFGKSKRDDLVVDSGNGPMTSTPSRNFGKHAFNTGIEAQ